MVCCPLRVGFLQRFTVAFLGALEDKFLTGPVQFSENSKRLASEVTKALINSLEPIVVSAVILYIEVTKREAPQRKNVYQELFSNDEEALNRLEYKCSTAVECMYRLVGKVKSSVIHTCNRVFHDWNNLLSEFEINPHATLNTVNFFAGDEHGVGQSTALFIFDQNGVKKGFVYKPINLLSHQVIYSIIAAAEADLGYKNYSPPKILIYNSQEGYYAYTEFLEYSGEVDEVSGAQEIYRSFGRLLSYANALKIDDGHYQNILIKKPFVYLLDLESAFTTSFSWSGLGDDLPLLERTGLLLKIDHKRAELGILSGVQGGIMPHVDLTSHTILNEGTDEIALRFYKIRDKVETANAIYHNQVLCKPEDYLTSIQQGYVEAYHYFLREKTSILKALRAAFAKTCICSRFLLCSTGRYVTCVNLLQNASAASQNNILGILRKERKKLISKLKKSFSEFIIYTEFEDLSQGVIPYYFRTNQSNALHHVSGSSAKGFFSTSLLQDLEKNIESMQEAQLYSDVVFIKEALFSTAGLYTWEAWCLRFSLQKKHSK